MERSRTLKPGPIVESDDIDDQGIAFPVPDRIPHIRWCDVIRMFRVKRNGSKHVHVLIQNHDLRGRLDKLDWKQSLSCGPRWTWRETKSIRIVDTTSLVIFEHLLSSPRLVRSGLACGTL